MYNGITLNHFAVHLKLTQYCKSTILQYKIKIKLKEQKIPCSVAPDLTSSRALTTVLVFTCCPVGGEIT